MTKSDCRIALQENLAESTDNALMLQRLLDEERSALKERDATLMHNTAAEKQLCVDRLDKLDVSRRKMCALAGFCDSIDSVPELIEWCDENRVIATSWERFLSVAEVCSNRNTENGAIIRVRQAQISEAIGLLRHGTTDANTYGPNGINAGELRPRSLAEA